MRCAKLAVLDVLGQAVRRGLVMPWGILTGVRPGKLAHKLLDSGLSCDELPQYLERHYLLPHGQAQLLTEICLRQGTQGKRALPLAIAVAEKDHLYALKHVCHLFQRKCAKRCMSSHNDTPSLVFYPEQGKLSRKLYSHAAIFSGKNKVTPSHGIFLHGGRRLRDGFRGEKFPFQGG